METYETPLQVNSSESLLAPYPRTSRKKCGLQAFAEKKRRQRKLSSEIGREGIPWGRPNNREADQVSVCSRSQKTVVRCSLQSPCYTSLCGAYNAKFIVGSILRLFLFITYVSLKVSNKQTCISIWRFLLQVSLWWGLFITWLSNGAHNKGVFL